MAVDETEANTANIDSSLDHGRVTMDKRTEQEKKHHGLCPWESIKRLFN